MKTVQIHRFRSARLPEPAERGWFKIYSNEFLSLSPFIPAVISTDIQIISDSSIICSSDPELIQSKGIHVMSSKPIISGGIIRLIVMRLSSGSNNHRFQFLPGEGTSVIRPGDPVGMVCFINELEQTILFETQPGG